MSRNSSKRWSQQRSLKRSTLTNGQLSSKNSINSLTSTKLTTINKPNDTMIVDIQQQQILSNRSFE